MVCALLHCVVKWDTNTKHNNIMMIVWDDDDNDDDGGGVFKVCSFGSTFKPREHGRSNGHCMLYACAYIVVEEWGMGGKLRGGCAGLGMRDDV